MSIGNYGGAEIDSIVAAASNIRTGDNPAYTLEDFVAVYPQFAESGGTFLVPEAVMNMYLDLAHACIKEIRWHDSWKVAMGWFIAHFLTLYLQGSAAAGSDAAAVIRAGAARGLQSSKSVGSVSVSYDFSAAVSDIDGWAAWKLTIYGQQLATMGRLVGKGNMYVY